MKAKKKKHEKEIHLYAQKSNTAFHSQNFILTYRCIDDAVSNETYMPFFLVCTQNKLTKCSGVEKQKKKKKVKSDEVKKKTRPQETTTKSYLVPVSQGRFFFFFIRPSGVRNSSSSSLMDSMRSVTSQVQQPQDDVTGVAAFQLAALLVCFVL